MEYIRTATREFSVGDAPTLDYDGRSGTLVVEGADTDRVTVQIVARIHEDRPEDADRIFTQAVEGVRQHEHAVSIVPPPTPSITIAGPGFLFNRGLRLDYAVTLPRSASCRAASRNGRVEIARLRGPVVVVQRSGKTMVREVAGDVQVESRSGAVELESISGAATVEARSGRVSARDVGGNLTVHAQSGPVQAERIGGTVEIHAQSGRIDVADAAGDVRLDAKSGRISVTEPGAGLRARSVSGAIDVRALVNGPYDLQAVSGAIRLEVDPRRPFVVDAETVSGGLRSDIAPRSGAPSDAAPTVRLRTVSGGITLARYHSAREA